MSKDKFEQMRRLVEEIIPFNRILGLKLIDADGGKASLRFDFRDDLVGNFKMGILHGGVISSVLDVAGAVAVISSIEGDEPLKGLSTVDLRIDFLLPGGGNHFIATGHVMRPGRTLASTRMELRNDDDKLIAIGSAVYRVSTKDEYILMSI